MEIAMNLWVRSWTAAGIAVLALTSIPEIYAASRPPPACMPGR
jgi:hypothetical protein